MSAQMNSNNQVSKKDLNFDNKAIVTLAQELNQETVSLVLNNCQIDNNIDLRPLTKAIENCPRLQHIVIQYGKISSNALKQLCSAIKESKSKLQTFHFTYNDINFGDDFEVMLEALERHKGTMIELNLSGLNFSWILKSNNQVKSVPNFIRFSRLIYNLPKLTDLKLMDCALYDAHLISILSQGLKHSKSLRTLDLSNNLMDNDNVYKILNALLDQRGIDLPATIHNLEMLNLAGNIFSGAHFTERGFHIPEEDLNFYLIQMKTLRTTNTGPLIIDLGSNIMPDQVLSELEKTQKQLGTELQIKVANNNAEIPNTFISQIEKNKHELESVRKKLIKDSKLEVYFEGITEFKEKYEKELQAMHQRNAKLNDEKEVKESKASDETLLSLAKEIREQRKQLNRDSKITLQLKGITLTASTNINPLVETILSGKITHVVITHCSIDEESFYILCKALRQKGIVHFDFSYNKINFTNLSSKRVLPVLIEVFAANLEINHIDLSGVNFNPSKLNILNEKEIPIFSYLGHLKTLILKECNLQLSDLRYICDALTEHPSLTELDLSYNNLRDIDSFWIIGNLSYRGPKNDLSINLSSNLLFSTCVDRLITTLFKYGGSLLFPPKIKGINLSNNALSKEDIQNFRHYAMNRKFFAFDNNNEQLGEKFKKELEELRAKQGKPKDILSVKQKIQDETCSFSTRRRDLFQEFGDGIKAFIKTMQPQTVKTYSGLSSVSAESYLGLDKEKLKATLEREKTTSAENTQNVSIAILPQPITDPKEREALKKKYEEAIAEDWKKIDERLKNDRAQAIPFVPRLLSESVTFISTDKLETSKPKTMLLKMFDEAEAKRKIEQEEMDKRTKEYLLKQANEMAERLKAGRILEEQREKARLKKIEEERETAMLQKMEEEHAKNALFFLEEDNASNSETNAENMGKRQNTDPGNKCTIM